MDNYFYAVWMTTISLTTTGYGDISATTLLGQYLTLSLTIWGALLLSILYGLMEKVFDPDEKQAMALRHILSTRKAATAILYSMKFFIEKKRYNKYKLDMYVLDPKKLKTKKKVSWTFNIMLETNKQIITDPHRKYVNEPLIP